MLKRNYLILLSLILFLLAILGCKEKQLGPGEIEIKKIIHHNREIDLTSITRRNVTIADTFFLIKKDFLYQDGSYYVHHYRSIENEFYNSLVPKIGYKDFSLSNNPYSNSSSKPKTIKTDLKDFPTSWTETVYFGKEYYLKYPSDFCGLNQKIVTDSCLIQKTCEGPLPFQLNKISKIRSNQYLLKTGHELFKSDSIIVTIIDSIRGIAIWQNSENEFELLADVNKFKKIPGEKEEGNGNKCAGEIESDDIDYKALINDAIN